ncbi:hypothetical protein RvY_03884 [Ramazzottius varieornatus]|uniref:Uncharacterized protein n=1 Tax=Ramazzottius varieornatus TaxID=947166 RepID=A0A1D1UPN5_RAMVA|nr:hypothetical protein RvY_03884 [Ramazzottius varieornatus]
MAFAHGFSTFNYVGGALWLLISFQLSSHIGAQPRFLVLPLININGWYASNVAWMMLAFEEISQSNPNATRGLNWTFAPPHDLGRNRQPGGNPAGTLYVRFLTRPARRFWRFPPNYHRWIMYVIAENPIIAVIVSSWILSPKSVLCCVLENFCSFVVSGTSFELIGDIARGTDIDVYRKPSHR